MSFITQASSLNTANQIIAWNQQAISSMGSAKAAFTSILAQRQAMESNNDFTQQDIAEVDAMLNNILQEAKSLIPENA